MEKVLNNVSCNGVSFNLKEECKFIKETDREVESEKFWNSFELDIYFEPYPLEKKIALLFNLLATMACLSVYNSPDPNIEDGFWRIFREDLELLNKLSKFINEKFKYFQCLPPDQEVKEIKNLIVNFSWIFNYNQVLISNLIPEKSYELIDIHVEIVKNFIEIFMAHSNIYSSISCLRSFFKILLKALGYIQDAKNQFSIDILKKIEKIMYNLKEKNNGGSYNSFGEENILILLMIFEKLIQINDNYYNEDKLKRFSIEMKIKRCFYDKLETKKIVTIDIESFKNNEIIFEEYAFSRSIFYEVFHSLCEISDSGSKVSLRSGVGKIFSNFFFNFFRT